jgi:hypothetical protein
MQQPSQKAGAIDFNVSDEEEEDEYDEEEEESEEEQSADSA